MNHSNNIRGRYAPSPSGRMHLGNVMCALISWASARGVGGEFVLRIEDLDTRCLDPELTRLLIDDLRWLGIDWDGEPLIQSADTSRYDRALEMLSHRAHVYPCFCRRADLHAASAPHADDGTPVYARTCRNLSSGEVAERALEKDPSLRVEITDTPIGFTDGHYGLITQNLATDCGDFVVKRADGVYAYQLASVVDDAFQEVTQVIRGCDLLLSTPRQIYLQSLLDLPTPHYFHHPLLVDSDRRRLSKRQKDIDMGYLREHYSSEELIALVARIIGIDAGRSLSPLEFARTFSWDSLSIEDIDASGFL